MFFSYHKPSFYCWQQENRLKATVDEQEQFILNLATGDITRKSFIK
nr:hypothetical protein [Desulfosarcina sp. BuS5]